MLGTSCRHRGQMIPLRGGVGGGGRSRDVFAALVLLTETTDDLGK